MSTDPTYVVKNLIIKVPENHPVLELWLLSGGIIPPAAVVVVVSTVNTALGCPLLFPVPQSSGQTVSPTFIFSPLTKNFFVLAPDLNLGRGRRWLFLCRQGYYYYCHYWGFFGQYKTENEIKRK